MFNALLNLILRIPSGNRTFATSLLQIIAALIVLAAMGLGLMPSDQSAAAVALFAIVDGFKAIFSRAAMVDSTVAQNPVEYQEPVVIAEPTIVGKEYPK